MNTPENESGILGLLEHIHSGKETLHEEIDAHIKEAHRLLQLHGGKAKLTITIDMKREAEYENFYKVTGRSVLKPPPVPAKAAPMFGDIKNGGFTSQVQEQATIFGALQESSAPGVQLAPAAGGTVSPLKKKD